MVLMPLIQDQLELQTVSYVKVYNCTNKTFKEGESVSYNRKGVVKRDSVIATIRIGYADGYSTMPG